MKILKQFVLMLLVFYHAVAQPSDTTAQVQHNYYFPFFIKFDTFSVEGIVNFITDSEIKVGAEFVPEIEGVYINYCYSNFPPDFLRALSCEHPPEKIVFDSLFIATRKLSLDNLYYWISIYDANMDGVLDIGLIQDLGIRNSSDEIWVNIKGKLYHWYGMSGKPVWEWDKKKRMVKTGWYEGGGKETTQWYKIVSDTTMIPVLKR